MNTFLQGLHLHIQIVGIEIMKNLYLILSISNIHQQVHDRIVKEINLLSIKDVFPIQFPFSSIIIHQTL